MWLIYILTILVVFLDVSGSAIFSVRGVCPDLLMVWIFCLSLTVEADFWQIVLVAGLLKDFLVGGVWGKNFLILYLVNIFSLLMRKSMSRLLFLDGLTLSLLSVLLSQLFFDRSLNLSLLFLGRVFYNFLLFISFRLFLEKRFRSFLSDDLGSGVL